MTRRSAYFSIPGWKRFGRAWTPGMPARLCGGILSVPMRLLFLCTLLLAGCAGLPDNNAPSYITSNARVTQVQACAIGYDLARQIHDRVSPRRTILLAPSRASDCETHALDYLRRAGFRIDETGQGGARFDIALSRSGPEVISAVARIGDDLRIARSYRMARTGVVAIGPVSIQHLAPESFRTAGAGS